MASRSRRPSSSIESMCIYNRVDGDERWIPIIIKIGSWITMLPNKRRKFNEQSNHFISAWKGKVKDFKVDKGKKMVLIQHVYMHKELQLLPNIALPRHRANCKSLIFTSFYCLISNCFDIFISFQLSIIQKFQIYIPPILRNGKIWRAWWMCLIVFTVV